MPFKVSLLEMCITQLKKKKKKKKGHFLLSYDGYGEF